MLQANPRRVSGSGVKGSCRTGLPVERQVFNASNCSSRPSAAVDTFRARTSADVYKADASSGQPTFPVIKAQWPHQDCKCCGSRTAAGGNDVHFRVTVPVGPDSKSGGIHTVRTSTAKVTDCVEPEHLLQGEEYCICRSRL